MKSFFSQGFAALNALALLLCAACGPSLSLDEPMPDAGPTVVVKTVAPVIPCPDDLSGDLKLRTYGFERMLAEHPNPACSRDWVCTPITTTWEAIPVCRWVQIAKGDESKTVWLTLGAPRPYLVMETDAQNTTSTSFVGLKMKTSTWYEFTKSDSTDQVTTVEAVQPGTTPMAEGSFSRLEYTAARTFTTKACPRVKPNVAPYNANCGVWMP